MQPYRGGFLVNDAHHNRVLKVGLDGRITQLIQFGDIVPTGLALRGNTIYVAEAGPIPHLPQNGKIVSFNENHPPPLRSHRVLLSWLTWSLVPVAASTACRRAFPHTINVGEGTPADPDSGSLVKVNSDGTFTVIVDRLNLPTSMEFIGNTAYVVTLNGEIWRIAHVLGCP